MYIFLCTYISINSYVTVSLGTSIIDSVSLSGEETGDKDELFFLSCQLLSRSFIFPMLHPVPPSTFIQVS